MNNKYFIYLIYATVCLMAAPLHSAPRTPFLFSSSTPKKVEVNNRILAVVNGNPITVYDLMKKLDVIFYKQFPQYAESVETKFQFYQYNWKLTLRDLIDKQLILADAEEVKLPVTSGDVRQEMETSFGPNIIANLDKLGMSYDEAYEIVKGDIIIKRMMGARVSNKAQRRVIPQVIKQMYDEYAKDHTRPAEWNYQIISIRHSDTTRAAEIANSLYRFLKEEKISIDDIQEHATRIGLIDSSTKLNISKLFQHNESEVSESYKTILSSFDAPNTVSEPQVHNLRNSGDKIIRIFYVHNLVKGGPIPFEEVESKLINDIRNSAMDEETNAYLEQLRTHFHVNEDEIFSMLPEDFEPFTLH